MLCTLAFLFPAKAFPQFPVYENYTVKDGLPSQVVYYSLQDQRGYIWFATDAGVSRFDGIHFKNFTVKDGLADNDVIGLYEDVWGRLWFLAFNGRLSYFLNDSIFNDQRDTSLRIGEIAGEISNVYQRANGNFWISYNSGSVLEVGKKGVLNELKFSEKGFFVWCFPHEVNDHEYWMFTRNGYYKYVNGIKDTLSLEHFKPVESYYFCMKSTSKGESFFNNQDGIRCLQGNKNTLVIPAERIPYYSEVKVVIVDENRDLWMFTKQHNTYFWKRTGEGYEPKGLFFGETHIGFVFTDHEKNIWFCSTGNGVFEIRLGGLESHVYQDKIPDANQILSVKLCPDGSIWYGNSFGNLYILRNDSVEKFSFPSRSIEVRDIQFKEGEAYFATQLGLFRKSISPSHSGILQLSIHNITNLQFNGSNELILATARGIFKTSDYRKNLAVLSPITMIEPLRSYCIFTDFSGKLWYENFEYLHSFDKDHVENYPQLSGRVQSRITGISQTTDSTILIGTYGNGIFFLKDNKIVYHLTSLDGLAGDLCTYFLVRSDTVYAATRSGFSIFQYSDGKVSGLKTITTANGILSNDINALCIAGDKIYLATSGGLCTVNKNVGERRSDPPPVYITSVLVGKEEQKNLYAISLPFNTGMEINWSALTYQQPENLDYQYRFRGGDWLPTKTTSIYLSSLSPAHYDFQVRSRKINSDWSPPVSLSIDITPLFWQQWWFRLAVVLALMIAVYFLIRVITVRRYQRQMVILRQQQSLSEERNRIASDMHDDFGADLSNLLMLTRLTHQSAELPAKEKKQLEKMEQFISGAITKVDEIIWALNPMHDSTGDLIRFLRQYVSDFKERSSISVHDFFPEKIPDTTIPSKFRRNIVLVVKEALNNIHRHSQATEVEFILHADKDYLTLEIRDNGIGIQTSEKATGGNGLFNMKKRVAELNGTFRIKSEDGTTLGIKIPLHKKT